MTGLNPLWHKALSVFTVDDMFFRKIVIFRKDIGLIEYIITIFGLFCGVTAGLVLLMVYTYIMVSGVGVCWSG